MQKWFVLFVWIIAVQVSGAFAQEPEPFVLGQVVQMESKILNQTRILNVYLPPDYQDSTHKAYDVIFLLDGSADEDFIHIAGLLQFGNFPWIGYYPQVILVGIANINRSHDFTYPSRVPEDQALLPLSGGSAAFIEFIAKELQPFIASKYSCNGKYTLIGQSLGGLLATEILMTQPDLFDRYLIVSPSLWWDGGGLLEKAWKRGEKYPLVFVAVGNEGPKMVKPARRLWKLANAKSNARCTYLKFKQLDHADILHLAAYDGLIWLFDQKIR